MKTIYKSIGPRDSVPHFPARSEGRVEREERAMWTCLVCGVGLQYNYDGHFELCLEHKDGGEGRVGSKYVSDIIKLSNSQKVITIITFGSIIKHKNAIEDWKRRQ